MWVKIDDSYPEHPKLAQAGPLAMALDLAAICYCARHLTDGHVPTSVARRLIDTPNPEDLIATLLRVGRWETAAGGYLIHDYLDYNPARAQVRARRQADTRRQAEWRASHRTDDGRYSTECHGVTDGVTSNRPVPVPVPVPVPSPDPDPSSSSTPAAAKTSAGGRHAPDLLLLLNQLLDHPQLRDAGRADWAAQALGLDADHRAIWIAQAAHELAAQGVEPAVARELAMTNPDACFDWLDHPERWRSAKNPAGLLVKRLRRSA